MKNYILIIQTAAWLAILAFALLILTWLWFPLIWLLAGVGLCCSVIKALSLRIGEKCTKTGGEA